MAKERSGARVLANRPVSIVIEVKGPLGSKCSPVDSPEGISAEVNESCCDHAAEARPDLPRSDSTSPLVVRGDVSMVHEDASVVQESASLVYADDAGPDESA